MKNTELIEKLYENQNLEDCELLQLINTISEEEREKLFYYARRVREREYGNDVYIRGLIEFTNWHDNMHVQISISLFYVGNGT